MGWFNKPPTTKTCATKTSKNIPNMRGFIQKLEVQSGKLEALKLLSLGFFAGDTGPNEETDKIRAPGFPTGVIQGYQSVTCDPTGAWQVRFSRRTGTYSHITHEKISENDLKQTSWELCMIIFLL